MYNRVYMSLTQPLANKSILLGITGGIAAFKCPELIRQLQMLGADVRVVMTDSARAFVTPLTLQTLSRAQVHLSQPPHKMLPSTGEIDHITLARWADIILIAPASAHCLAKLAYGLADDLLSTLCLATTAPIVVAPAMNQAMWRHPSTQTNKTILEQRGVTFWGPDVGEQACQEVGPGRLLDTPKIADAMVAYFADRAYSSQPTASASSFSPTPLKSKPVIITAGPTQEPLDPVRYISNYSSGKMGYALAAAAVQAGAKVTLISGPTTLTPPLGVTIVAVNTAQEMLAAVKKAVTPESIFISTAAVADFKPATYSSHKIKKATADKELNLSLTRTTDILSSIAKGTCRPAYVVGFAAETNNLEAHARKKLNDKQLDLIVANDVSKNDRGFESDNNEVLLLGHSGQTLLPLQPKVTLAIAIMAFIASNITQVTQPQRDLLEVGVKG